MNKKQWIQNSSTAFEKFNANEKPRISLQFTVSQGLLHLASPPKISVCRHSA
jgi:hypothetical protein